MSASSKSSRLPTDKPFLPHLTRSGKTISQQNIKERGAETAEPAAPRFGLKAGDTPVAEPAARKPLPYTWKTSDYS